MMRGTTPTFDFAPLLGDRPVVGIFRDLPPDQTVELCQVAWDAGVRAVEIPVRTPRAMDSFTAAVEAAGERGEVVGAGSVVDPGQLRDLCQAGAAFTVAPGVNPQVIESSCDLGVPHLPGVATSTDITVAVGFGLCWLKAFPAAQLGAGWIAAQLAPFPEVRFVATGGITTDNARSFLDAGCSAVAVGSAFTDPEKVRALARLAVPTRHPS